MTKAEAITILNGMRNSTTYGRHVCDALDMAIEALEQPEIVRCKDCIYGQQDEEGRWRCGDVGAQFGADDGSGFCCDGERKEKTDDKN